MILAKCIFSQSATGVRFPVCIFSQVGHISGWGVQIFAKRAPNGDEGEEEGDEEEEGRKRRRNPNLIAAATKFPM